MLNFQLLMTEKDRKEAAAIERRRLLEEERKKRIFNPRTRLIGIDTEILKRQVDEKNQRDSERRRIDKIFEDQLKKSDEIAVALEQKEKEERLKYQQEIDNFRKNFQKPEDRREFDLNDPNLIKKQLPVRLHDNDPRLGPSSAQKFEGEDLTSEQRAKIQREETKAWLDQQMMEKEMADKERKTADEAYKAAVIIRDQRAIELDRMEQECRKKLQTACLRFNKALADEKSFMLQKEKQKTLEDNSAEVYNCLTSDLLTENPDVAQSNLGQNRKIGFLYKGMTDEERQNVRKDQLTQIEQAKKNKELQTRLDREMDDFINGTQKSIYMMDRALERRERESRKKLVEENKRMAEDQINRKLYIEKIIYSNVPTEKYYDQFNKTSR